VNAQRHSASRDARTTQLALKAGRGDRTALSAFVKETHDDVWRFLAHLAGPELADDLTQDTYVRVMGALPRFAGRSTARTWLLSLARRVWIDNIRHERARPRKSHSELEDLDPIHEDSSVWSEWIDARTMIASLPDERREALVLTQILGYSYEEAAAIAGVRIGTIRSRVARARKDILAEYDN